MFTKQTIKDWDFKKTPRVLLRADYNVPIAAGKITDDYRVQQSLPTVQYLLKQKARLVIIAHLGRPSGPRDTANSLRPVAARLSKLLNQPVKFADDCIGPVAEKAANDLKPGEVLLLENLRFHPEEEKNDEKFAEGLARLGDVFVQDGFGVVHRAHASTDGVARLLPGVAGLLLEKEVDTITKVMEQPERPLMAIVGGAKIADKIDILHRFIEIADVVAIGGAMANTFLKAQGHDLGKSLVDIGEIPIAKDILKKAEQEAKKRKFIFYVPQDGVVAKSIDAKAKTRIVDWSTHTIAEIESYPKRPTAVSQDIGDDDMVLDVGPFSGSFMAGAMQLASTVVWNGTLGVTETNGLQGPIGPFAHGTELVIDALLGEFGHRPFSLVGGGDTVGYIQSRKLTDCFNHVSTGGGASLELMAGRTLPGVAVLKEKKHA
ncbi:MAG: phosphoglycerate kinase [Candidatus Saccharibacteria bacterium]|nr:phosphoglycerate kinase [Candidatus Saccharibacteria bacterium]